MKNMSIAAFSLAATFCSGAMAAPETAQWPDHPVRVVVPFAAGGITDMIARIASERLHAKFNQPFIVENEAGATGTIAALRVARADPDGYTLFFAATNQIVIAPFTHKIAYDPFKDFVAVAMVGTAPFVPSVGSTLPVKSLTELVAYAKANPGKVTYGSSGQGSLAHMASAFIAKKLGVDMVHVPYRGVGPAFQDLLAGHIDVLAVTPVELQPCLGTDKVRPLAVADDRPSPSLPGVPLVSDTIPAPPIVTWEGYLAPAATPHAIVEAISAEFVAAGKDPTFVGQLEKVGLDTRILDSKAFGEFIAADYERWKIIVQEIGLKPPS